jgi:hypothetical protein
VSFFLSSFQSIGLNIQYLSIKKKSAKSSFFTDTQQMSHDFQVIRLEIKKREPISIQFNAKRKAALTNSFSAK